MTIQSAIEQRMIHNMVEAQINEPDRKAIGKARQFSAAEIESTLLFANRLPTPIGLQEALAQLNERELTALHLLTLQNEPVTVDFFARLYHQVVPQKAFNYTFNQTYNDLFREVRQRLVRKGLVIWAEIADGNSKLERYRFAALRVLADHVPPLIRNSQPLPAHHASQASAFRAHLPKMMKSTKQSPAEIDIQDGILSINGQPLSREAVQAWQELIWWRDVLAAKHGKPIQAAEIISSAIPMIVYALDQLPPGHWVQPDTLTTLLELHYLFDQLPNPAKLLEIGWRSGRLDQTRVDQVTYYRLASWPDWEQQPIDDYLLVKDKTVRVDLEKAPFDALALLGQIADLIAEGDQLFLKPNITRLTKTYHVLRDDRLCVWLRANSPTFAEVFQRLDEQWGKLLVHENLLFARVSDLSLRVTLQKSFQDAPVIFLPAGWIAFPPNLVRQIETVVNRSGHVIKREVRRRD